MKNTTILAQIIQNRRTIYPHQFTGEKLPDETVREILASAIWAPTHGKTEPWFFYILKGESLKNFIRFKAEVYRKITSETDFSEKKFTKILERAESCSHIITVVCQTGKNPKIPRQEEIEAVACAVQNMLLTASAYSTGVFWATGEFTENEEIRSEFALSEQDLLLGFLYLGVPKPELNFSVTRTGIAEKCTFLD
jgi:nitroreductase